MYGLSSSSTLLHVWTLLCLYSLPPSSTLSPLLYSLPLSSTLFPSPLLYSLPLSSTLSPSPLLSSPLLSSTLFPSPLLSFPFLFCTAHLYYYYIIFLSFLKVCQLQNTPITEPFICNPLHQFDGGNTQNVLSRSLLFQRPNSTNNLMVAYGNEQSNSVSYTTFEL